MDPEVVTNFLMLLDEKYGTMTPITVHQGKAHDYLGMTLDFSTAKKCVIRMDNFVQRII